MIPNKTSLLAPIVILLTLFLVNDTYTMNVDTTTRRDPKIPEYEYRWKIRGKTAVALLYGFKPAGTIFLTPIEGRIDTIFYQKMLEKDTSQWSNYLTRISVSGNYEGFTGSCCGRFHVVPSPKTETTQNNVIFRMISSDGKMYLAKLGDNGVILKAGVDAHLERACDLFMVSGNETFYREIAIEEIDTSALCIRQHIDNEEDDEAESAVEGTSGAKPTDSIEVKSLACVNSADADSVGTFSYCVKRTVTSFQFIWLDNAPLIVEFDPVRQKVVLR